MNEKIADNRRLSQLELTGNFEFQNGAPKKSIPAQKYFSCIAGWGSRMLALAVLSDADVGVLKL